METAAGWGELRLRLLHKGGDTDGLHVGELRCRSRQAAKRHVAFKYALRVSSLLIWAVKNSSTPLRRR